MLDNVTQHVSKAGKLMLVTYTDSIAQPELTMTFAALADDKDADMAPSTVRLTLHPQAITSYVCRGSMYAQAGTQTLPEPTEQHADGAEALQQRMDGLESSLAGARPAVCWRHQAGIL